MIIILRLDGIIVEAEKTRVCAHHTSDFCDGPKSADWLCRSETSVNVFRLKIGAKVM